MSDQLAGHSDSNNAKPFWHARSVAISSIPCHAVETVGATLPGLTGLTVDGRNQSALRLIDRMWQAQKIAGLI